MQQQNEEQQQQEQFITTIPYKIHSSSHNISPYIAENIKSSNHELRWSTHLTLTSTTQQQQRQQQSQQQQSQQQQSQHVDDKYILLELNQVSILRVIKFGKCNKIHPCNMREFKVYGCNDDVLSSKSQFTLLLHSKLKNDTTSESFPLKFKLKDYNNLIFTTKFVKIEAMNTHSAHHFPSIWHVKLYGITDVNVVQKAHDRYQIFVESENRRAILYHLRLQNEMDLFQTMLNRCQHLFSEIGFQFEHVILSQLFDSLVVHGDFEKSEQLLHLAMEQQLFHWYYQTQINYNTTWHKIPKGSQQEQEQQRPGMRGGHQMCMDSENGDFVYLFGGWDGRVDLDDFWCYDIRNGTWKCISMKTENEGGPSPRSCHKMVYDNKRHRIYTFGRYCDTLPAIGADFHYYDVKLNVWQLVSNDTASQNGPPLLYDHQMVIDCTCDNIYILGGRTTTTTSNSSSAGFFFMYNIDSNKWKRIVVTNSNNSNSSTTTSTSNQQIPQNSLRADTIFATSSVPLLANRHAHSMVTLGDSIYIFGGVHNKDHIREFHVFNPQNRTIRQQTAFSGNQSDHTPEHSMNNTSTSTNNATGATSTTNTTTMTTMTTGQTNSSSASTTAASNISNSAIFHQQLTGRTDRQELFIFSNGWMTNTEEMEAVDGMTFNSNYGHRNDLWVYDINYDQWNYLCSLHSTTSYHHHLEVNERSDCVDITPMPRFASQFIYSAKHDAHFLFGGNAGDLLPPNERLDDFWMLKCSKPSIEQGIIRPSKLILRQQKFLEMCQDGCSAVDSLMYLRSHITHLVTQVQPPNHEEQNMLHTLTSHVMFPAAPTTTTTTTTTRGKSKFQQRVECFESISQYFNPSARAPGFPSVGRISSLLTF